MFFVYQLLLSLIFLISPIIILFRILKGKEDKKRFTEKFAIFSKKRKPGKLIWFHGASVGEILSVIPLIEKYEKDKSIDQILVTTTTLSSAKVVKKFNFKKLVHQFYVMDMDFLTSKFLDFWKPSVAIFIDSEIWPSMFKQVKKRKIPLLLLNARITKKSFKRWKKLKSFSSSIFKLITKAYPQNFETIKFLKRLGVKKIKYIGNLKYAENYSQKRDLAESNLRKKFKNKKIWIASSTHKDEEIFCAKAHLLLKKKINNLTTIIIPRHVNRVKEISSKLEKLDLKVASHTSGINKLNDIDIYLVDTFGETKKFYQMAYSVFLGGSIANRGGQNPLEAARFGAQILHGPNIDNFKDVYKFLSDYNISSKINNYKQLASKIVFNIKKNKSLKIKIIGNKILNNTIKEINFQIKNEI
ncbi:3-deoxy-D-manno-octulosonic acid transferase [Candidatus Pelagibacter sp. HIMB1782]|uniref:3-deoxy-D-manno-octulosonic acid transferase n=1 Tax=Candidatus Pelagibacter sp. HIMB1782 TaxID=3413375 RepID=UPI003F83A79E